ncbi:phenylalanine--tRNA ligase subunit beta [Mycoplasma sp. Z244B]|uniref:phenylalanine--tRNA ligase subunit beta n=1 Tax=Mycoplasma sp. Z244B TaxID=3401659 RepID=UPI003AAD0430
MLISLNHLNSLLKGVKLSASDVEKTLNSIGFEVEEVKPFSNVKGLQFCEVLSVKPNPNSDRLDVVEVKTKSGQYTIQTNNRILKPGDLTICFPIGASKGDFTFSEVELKGLPSQGMFGAWSEIGYDWKLLSKKDQIVTFDPSFASLNDDPIEKLGLDDYLIEISITANRNDANSYFVLARELAAYYGAEVNYQLMDTTIKASELVCDLKLDLNNKAINDAFYLPVAAPQASVDLADKMLLAKHGFDTNQSWANNVANMLLLMAGTPAQVYDLDKLPAKAILSAKKFSGNVIVEDKEALVKYVLAIYANNELISLAGVSVLNPYQISEQTKNFLFEVAAFMPSEIRHTLREIKMSNPAGAQASRPITKHLAYQGMKTLAQALLKQPSKNQFTNVPQNNAKTIKFELDKLAAYGGKLDAKRLEFAYQALSNLGFKLASDLSKITIPEYRYDVNVMEDVIEEILRFYSYDGIGEEILASVPLKTMKSNPTPANFVAQGYSEVRTFTLVSHEKAQFNPFNFTTNQVLQTYVSKEREVVRNSIITSLAGVVEYNLKRKMNDINIFEKGMINNNVMVYGMSSSTKTFRQMQLDLINLTGKDLKFVPLADNEMIHPNASAEIIFHDEMVGWIGKIHPKYDTTNGTLYAEILTSMFNEQSSELKFEAVNLEPLKTLDITFELDTNDYVSPALDFINQIDNATNELQTVKVIDQFQKGDKVNTTVRFVGTEQIISLIDAKFNKKGE